MIIALLILNFGCDRSNPKVMALPETYGTVSLQTTTSQINLHPKVDVLFVIDNSQSMDMHQNKLANNIDSFVKAFSANESLDYHIGVISVFDSHRQGPGSKHPNAKPRGELFAFNGIDKNLPQNFYTRKHNDPSQLEALLKIGVLSLEKGGPEREESFSPLIAALSEPMLSSATNFGFYRPDAHLVVIFITDAADASLNLTPGQVYDFILNLKQGDKKKIHTFGVLADRNNRECDKVDPSLHDPLNYAVNSGKPDTIIDFISISRGRKLSICSEDYGPMLSAMGKEIEVKATHQSVFLDTIPEPSTLCICKMGDNCKESIGAQSSKCINEGWKYDPANIAIIFDDIAGLLKSLRESGSISPDQVDVQLEISFTPIKIQNLINGRTRKYQ
jgi:hypothetical protein